MALTRHSHFLAHSSNVNCLRFGHKSGQVAATGGDDNMVNVWRMREAETKNIMSLSGHQSAVESIMFDPAECKVVAGSQAGSIKVFDLDAGKVIRTLKGHMASTISVDYHLYGDYVASGSRDTIVKVWDLRTKSCMLTFKGHSSEATVVSFTPDGRWLTSGDQGGNIKIWDLTAGRLLHEFPDHGGAITSLEFNPEEFILVSSAADRTVRFWDVQEFALIGVTPVDNAITTSMSHTVAEPYSGKYIFCCSQEAVRVWSYETAIECHDSVMMPHQKELGFVEVHADTIMTEDMKLVGGCIQNAFVSVWVLDVMQMRPFNCENSDTSDNVAINTRRPTSSALKAVGQSLAHPVTPGKVSGSDISVCRYTPTSQQLAQESASNLIEQVSRRMNTVYSRPTTPGVLVPSTESILRPSRRTDQCSELVTHLAGARQDSPISQQMKRPIEVLENASDQSLPPSHGKQSQDKTLVTSDYIMELRCGMDTFVKVFKARQICIQQLLAHWEKGHLHEGLRFLNELPKGKREAVVVDVLLIADLSSLGVDLEACVLLLPLIVEVFQSESEKYLSVAIASGQNLFDAFSPIVKDTRDARRYRSRLTNLAEEERTQRCNACDIYFQEMKQRVQFLAQKCTNSPLQSKVHTLAQVLGEFYDT
ncbi:Microtubule severing protein katanin p80 subunit B (contains WD40 repeats) [Plasmopara halstedii]|uniref:Katanin p80 WD40 repeat-containing subunit B1 homolog n=1 Tax=Plasmopara halstedii TaxID=4781 RepID=A0A0P1ALU6_PLAHL|nr:Microtubule severing protein katanin p80 subunit B (contains WD40 repeats) [Plasmopara halstedii]CEG42308.1 Microtubule severing protein katanin p80 subunit B (contains WD40 repeats) [Plasmopara halstedii]|eukprot:XP_024578677.1 Microtubule severing protein katanin p80 subunit B (contains WD40 repeats) [Plasmopara halstedii]